MLKALSDNRLIRDGLSFSSCVDGTVYAYSRNWLHYRFAFGMIMLRKRHGRYFVPTMPFLFASRKTTPDDALLQTVIDKIAFKQKFFEKLVQNRRFILNMSIVLILYFETIQIAQIVLYSHSSMIREQFVKLLASTLPYISVKQYSPSLGTT